MIQGTRGEAFHHGHGVLRMNQALLAKRCGVVTCRKEWNAGMVPHFGAS